MVYINMPFRFSSQYLHLTYKSHIPRDALISFLERTSKREIKCKIAHETGDEHHSYLHTHVLVYFGKRVDTRSERKFDYEGIHPHWQKINDYTHWLHLLKYLEKENCIYNGLVGNEFPKNTGLSKNLRQVIQSHKSWYDVLNDDSITYDLQRMMNWARNVFDARPMPNLTKNLVLRKWQEQVVKRLDDQNDRQILWIYETKGNVGKSVLTNWLIDNRGAFFCNGGKMRDIAHAYQSEPIVVFDLPRTIEEFTPYRAMECFKDGHLFSPKYNSRHVRFFPPVVIVFANFEPEYEALSLDMWDIVNLDQDLDQNTQKSRGGPIALGRTPFGVVSLSDSDSD